MKTKTVIVTGGSQGIGAGFSIPEKYVYDGQYGHVVEVTRNAKNQYGGYVGEQVHQFMCFPNGSVSEINERANGKAGVSLTI